ncbi:L-sorbose 1-dehydrogenase [Parachaetomium inaequale]|uniref:L-sorbose 1-dehydrogenase n=1 Tax=Parachaetomium inaequale TaxID=2588326 RepID=A0AAN6PQV5_9PEZI|nr:L-sorbose 1-dehydrogenase [Parachaetomium inaequale]
MASEFDFIIVGGGTAGSVLAARLTENSDVQVLVVEAGEDLTADPRIKVPTMWPQLQATDADWKLKTVPQKALGNREILIPQGRLLGGSGALNGMVFAPPAQEELEAWADLGNPGWDWDGVSKYLKKTYTLTSGAKTEGDGVLQLNIPDEETKWPQVWRDTFAGLGFPAGNEPFSGQIHGVVSYPDAVHPVTKTRSFSGNAYLAPARSRPNLTVWAGVSVDRVLFEQTPDSAIATGVQYTKDAKMQTVTARKEVLLCAGTFYSPKILELSGIGDAERLQKLGIDVVVDNPYVGENLQNHPLCSITFEVGGDDDEAEGFETIDAIARQDPTALGAAMEAYKTEQRGPFSQTNFNVTAHIPFPGIATDDGKQDLDQILEKHTGTTTTNVPGSKTTREYATAHQSLIRSVLNSPTGASGYYTHFPGWAYFGPTVLHHRRDAEVLARHVRFLESSLAAAPPLAGRLKHRRQEVAAPSGWPRGFSGHLDEARRFVRETAIGAMHVTGTCSMMPREKGGVVDPRLRVYGTRNLRVVDASIMPFTTRANTMATVYGIAEKAADMIRAGL